MKKRIKSPANTKAIDTKSIEVKSLYHTSEVKNQLKAHPLRATKI